MAANLRDARDAQAMAGELRYRKDLYAGTAEHYDRFRPPYPEPLLDDLRARVPLGASSRVVDLACGTGQIAFALAAGVGEVCAIDQEPEFVAFGESKARRLGVANIRWTAGSAESIAFDGAFDLVAIGNAFHRLDRNAVAARLVAHLRPHGCVALLWGGGPWAGDAPWQQALHDELERWQDALGARDRVPEGWQRVIEQDPHAQVLQRAGLTYEGRFEFAVEMRWTVDSLIGFTYSTSFLSQAVLREHAPAFERELRARLLTEVPDGQFEQHSTFAYELARAT
jgi:SAM-dependent methyltransferase